MSERLTHSAGSSTGRWTELAVPFSLLLVAIHELMAWPVPEETGASLQAGLWVLFSLQCGSVIRNMLPQRAPASHHAMTAALGILIISWVFQPGLLVTPFAWIFALAAWNFLQEHPDTTPARLFSGLCSGYALCLQLSTVTVALPLLILHISLIVQKRKAGLVPAAVWGGGLAAGLTPLWSGALADVHLIPPVASSPGMLSQYLELIQRIPLVLLPFLLLGLGVACFQARTTCFALLVPMLIGLPLYTAALDTSSPQHMWILPVGLLSAYGVFRVLRGVEQGVRNSNPKIAGRVMPAGLVLLFLSYGIRLGSLVL